MAISGAELISKVSRRVSLPDNQGLFSVTDLLEFANDVIIEEIWPFLTGLVNEFNMIKDVIPLYDTEGNLLYPAGLIGLPPRCYGRVLREVKYLSTEDVIHNIPQIDLVNEDMVSDFLRASYIRGFSMMSDGVKLWGDLRAVNGNIIFHYTGKPPKILTPTDSADYTSAYADITGMTFGSDTFTFGTNTVGTYLNTYCPSGETRLFDIIRKSTGTMLVADVPLSRNTTLFLTDVLTGDDLRALAGFQVGGVGTTFGMIGGSVNTDIYAPDLMIQPAGLSSFTPGFPETDQLLILGVACRILEAQDHVENLQIMEARKEKVKQQIVTILGDRITGEPQTVTSARGIRRAVLRRRNWYGGW